MTFKTYEFLILSKLRIYEAKFTSYVSAYLLDPLLSPVHAIVNTFIGLVVFVIIASIGISYTGVL